MRFLRKYAFWLFLLVLLTGLIGAPAPQTARTRVADGFDFPVGKPDAQGYYRSRGFRARYHMGDDWNGEDGGNTDLGRPVYSVAHGYVVLARNMRMGWGNLVIVRHTFLGDSQMKTVDSVYAHLDKIMVRENQQVTRGQQIGTIGTGNGQYTAHLHFEIRKNLAIGYNQRAFPRDLTAYYSPIAFISQHRKLAGGGRSALIPINTFANKPSGAPPPPAPSGKPGPGRRAGEEATPTPQKKSPGFKVNRFDDSL